MTEYHCECGIHLATIHNTDFLIEARFVCRCGQGRHTYYTPQSWDDAPEWARNAIGPRGYPEIFTPTN